MLSDYIGKSFIICCCYCCRTNKLINNSVARIFKPKYLIASFTKKWISYLISFSILQSNRLMCVHQCCLSIYRWWASKTHYNFHFSTYLRLRLCICNIEMCSDDDKCVDKSFKSQANTKMIITISSYTNMLVNINFGLTLDSRHTLFHIRNQNCNNKSRTLILPFIRSFCAHLFHVDEIINS